MKEKIFPLHPYYASANLRLDLILLSLSNPGLLAEAKKEKTRRKQKNQNKLKRKKKWQGLSYKLLKTTGEAETPLVVPKVRVIGARTEPAATRIPARKNHAGTAKGFG